MADSSSWESCAAKKRADRSEDGQFFTPVPIARFLAGWLEESGLNRSAIHLLDAGAGGGALTAAVVDRITALRASGRLRKLKEMTLDAWELDMPFLPVLRRNLAACVEALNPKTEIEPQITQIDTDFEEVAQFIINPVW